MNRVAFCTFGCRLNQYDTETIRTLLENDGGWCTVSSRDDADVYVVNTCSVTARADATARKAIRRIHSERPDARIVVTGCYAQRAPEEISGLPGVTLVVGAADRAGIVPAIAAAKSGELRVAVSPVSRATKFLDVPITEMMEHSRAFVKVQEGCNESCTFCIVPQTRGVSRSRSPESVLRQVRALVDRGYVEIVLTGVHLGDYGLDLPGARRRLVDLIEAILPCPGLERFRLSSIEPASIAPELIALMAGEAKFARHLHVPLQSASNRVLARMNRRYTIESFSELMASISHSIPDCGIGTDVICGFPGESEEDFQMTFDWLLRLPVTYVHPFTYSARPGSRAQGYRDQVSGDVKKRRTRSLKRLSRDKNRAFRDRHVGRVEQVLVEQRGTGRGIVLAGWTDNYLRVVLEEGELAKALETVRIVSNSDDALVGERLGCAGGLSSGRLRPGRGEAPHSAMDGVRTG